MQLQSRTQVASGIFGPLPSLPLCSFEHRALSPRSSSRPPLPPCSLGSSPRQAALLPRQAQRPPALLLTSSPSLHPSILQTGRQRIFPTCKPYCDAPQRPSLCAGECLAVYKVCQALDCLLMASPMTTSLHPPRPCSVLRSCWVVSSLLPGPSPRHGPVSFRAQG